MFKKKNNTQRKPQRLDEGAAADDSSPLFSVDPVITTSGITDLQSSNQTQQGESNASRQPDMPGLDVPTPIIPKWYQPIQKKRMKQQLIKEALDQYAQGVISGKEIIKPSEKDITSYKFILERLDIKQLQEINKLHSYKLKLDALDRLKSIDKKKHAVVTIYNDNKTSDTGVAHIANRTFSRSGCTYLIIPSRGIYDPEFGMTHFYYYFNNPWPIEFARNKLPEGSPDGKLLDDTIEFKILTALANIEMSKQINFILLVVIVNAILSAAALLVSLRGFKII